MMKHARSVFLLPLLGSAVFLACGTSSTTSTSSGSTTNPTGGGGSSTYVDLDGGGPIAVPPDGAALCPSGVCNYQTGDGCASGSACVPTLSGSTATPACVAAGTAKIGEACSGTVTCVAGAVCAGTTCRKLCCGGDWTGCDDPTEHCIVTVALDGPSGPVSTGAMSCFPVNDCDALDPSSCATVGAAGTACLIADATGATACLPPGTGGAGDACPCQAGFTCTEQAGASPVCVRLCKAVEGGGSPSCESNEGVCTHYNRDPQGVGECQAP